MVGSAVEKVSVPVRASLENAGMLAIQLYAKTTMALWGESSLKGRKILKGEKKKDANFMDMGGGLSGSL